jgi:hypothetical protein
MHNILELIRKRPESSLCCSYFFKHFDRLLYSSKTKQIISLSPDLSSSVSVDWISLISRLSSNPAANG